MTLRYNVEIELSDKEKDIPNEGIIRKAIASAVWQNTGVNVTEIQGDDIDIIQKVEKETYVSKDYRAILPAKLLTRLLLSVKGK